MSQNEIRLGPVSKIIEKNLAESQIREAQAKKRLKQQGVLKPGEELKLPATFVEALRTRRNSTY